MSKDFDYPLPVQLWADNGHGEAIPCGFSLGGKTLIIKRNQTIKFDLDGLTVDEFNRLCVAFLQAHGGLSEMQLNDAIE